MGTVNDFGRALHLPNDIMSAIDVIIEGHSTRVDIGKMNSRYFINLDRTQDYEDLIAAGGDGTLNEVINGIAEHPNRPKIGIIPMGTVNDFGRALHLPNDIMSAIDVIIEGHSTRVDIGKMNSRYFIN